MTSKIDKTGTYHIDDPDIVVWIMRDDEHRIFMVAAIRGPGIP